MIEQIFFHFRAMDKRPAGTWLLIFFVCGFLACKKDTQPDVFAEHLEKYPDIRKNYIYQSVLRLANIKHDPDFDKLIRDVEKIIIYSPPADTTYQLTELRSSIRTSGYEELIDIRTAAKDRISLWVNESFPKPHYVGLLDTGAGDYIFEIDGSLNLEYASSLNVADQEMLRELLN